MTLTEAARRLGVDTSTIRHRLRRGDMVGEKVGPRAWLITTEEVERWERIGKLKRGPKPTRRPPPSEES